MLHGQLLNGHLLHGHKFPGWMYSGQLLPRPLRLAFWPRSDQWFQKNGWLDRWYLDKCLLDKCFLDKCLLEKCLLDKCLLDKICINRCCMDNFCEDKSINWPNPYKIWTILNDKCCHDLSNTPEIWLPGKVYLKNCQWDKCYKDTCLETIYVIGLKN